MRGTVQHVLLAVAALATVMVAACGGDDESATPTPTPTQTPSPTNTAARPTPTPSIEEEVRSAYLAYWDAYGAALLSLDATRAESSAGGAELQRIKDEVELLRAQRVAARVVVEHDFAVVQISERAATVVDRFVDRSFYVDPVTLQPPQGSGEGHTFMDTFHLERSNDGRWLVVRSTRQR